MNTARDMFAASPYESPKGATVDSLEFSSTDMIASNATAIGLGAYTREAVMAAAPRGRMTLGPSGDPTIDIDGTMVGGGLDEPSRMHVGEKVRAGNGAFILVFGIGTGLVPKQLRAMECGTVVVYEPDPGILRTLLEAGPADLGGIPIIADKSELQIRWMQLSQDCKNLTILITPGYDDLFKSEIAGLGGLIRDNISDSTLIDNTRRMRYQEWINNIFEHLPLLPSCTPILALAGKFKGVPAFIIGAGPSLDKNGPLIAEAAKKGIVFCCDVAGRGLAKVGVEPQVLVSLEGLNLSHLMADLPWIDRVIRAFSLSAHPDTLATGKGPLMPFHEAIPPFVPFRELVNANPAGVGGSVSTVAFSIAEQLGCDPIVFVGQDLAYTGGKTHASGTPFGGSRVSISREQGRMDVEWSDEMKEVFKRSRPGAPESHEELFFVPAWGGEGEVPTCGPFNACRQWFEVFAVGLEKASPGRRLINATEGGSHVEGFADIPLRKVLDELEPREITPASLLALAQVDRTPKTKREIVAWARLQARKARKVERAAKRVSETVSSAVSAVEGGNRDEINNVFAKLTEDEAVLHKATLEQPLAEAWSYAAISAAKKNTDARPDHGDIVDDARWGLLREAAVAAAVHGASRELATELLRLSRRLGSG